MNKGTPNCLAEEHLMLFGMVIQWFARHEVLMHEIMGTVSGSDATSIKLLTRGLSFTVKRDALFNLLRHRAVPLDRIDQVRKYLDPRAGRDVGSYSHTPRDSRTWGCE